MIEFKKPIQKLLTTIIILIKSLHPIMLIFIALFLSAFVLDELYWVDLSDRDGNLTVCLSSIDDPALYDKCKNAYNSFIKYYMSKYYLLSAEKGMSSYYWQRFTTIISFLIMIGVIVFGLYLSYLEFQKDKSSMSKFKFSTDGVEVSSNFLGVVILVISLAFGYLYLDKVYPVFEAPPTAQDK